MSKIVSFLDKLNHTGNSQTKNKKMKMTYPKIILTYFNIEARAEPVRLAFELGKIPYEDNRIDFSEWGNLKPTLPAGQLPILNVDDGPAQTQSGAMLRWAGSLNPDSGLYPPDKLYEIEEAIGLVEDMQNSWMPNLYIGFRPEKYGYEEGFSKTDEGAEKMKTMRETWIKNELPKCLGYLSSKIKKHEGKWLASSDRPTVADCLAVPALRSFTTGRIDFVESSCLECNPVIVDYLKRFCALDEIKGRYVDGLF